jgi:hypothetical protein
MGDDAYRADVESLLAVCAARGVAVQTIKSAARRRWAPDHTGPRFSWYEPLPEADALARSVRWVLSNPQVFLNSSSDARLLPTILDAAEQSGPPPSDAELEADIAALDVRPLFDGAELERI